MCLLKSLGSIKTFTSGITNAYVKGPTALERLWSPREWISLVPNVSVPQFRDYSIHMPKMGLCLVVRQTGEETKVNIALQVIEDSFTIGTKYFLRE